LKHAWSVPRVWKTGSSKSFHDLKRDDYYFPRPLLELFDYVEPAENNKNCYSYRIHALLLRACIEVEANLKAILKEHGYSKSGDWNMGDYKKVNTTHHLSSFQVKVPNWDGENSLRKPFVAWKSGNPLPWYQAYNATKHDRHLEFTQATFEHLLDATCGLLSVLSAQFGTMDFSSSDMLISMPGVHNDGMESGIGSYFRVRFPEDWPEEEKYDFNWHSIMNENDPFQTFDYMQIA
jgi:hypothetical protein